MHGLTINTAIILIVLALYAELCAAAEEHHKRAPSGFTGVRGKKSIPDSAYSDETATDALSNSVEILPSDAKTVVDVISDVGPVHKRVPSGFMGMRGKKMYPNAWDGGAYGVATPLNAVYDKRAPSGFMGMRGKKDMEFSGYGDDNMKRAPSGFVGMRGKKTSYYDDNQPILLSSSLYKRAPMGFMGMRGKKDDYLMDDDDEALMGYGGSIAKRAPSGFFGMRGKKQPTTKQSGFFGMRGKKYPYEFRGKFVGVRGKKMSNEVTGPDYYNDIDVIAANNDAARELDFNQLMLLLTENNNEGDGVVWRSSGATTTDDRHSQK